jgi:hypothetical protein
MFKRTKGYFLLTMLVLTGLAGRMHTNTLSGKERRQLIHELKNDRTELIARLSGKTDQQLTARYKGGASIKDYIFRMANIEYNLWHVALSTLQQKDTQSTFCPDQELLSNLQRSPEIYARQFIQVHPIDFTSIAEAMKVLQDHQEQMIKYLKTTTDDARHHSAPTSIGTIDAYQMMMVSAFYVEYYLKKIEEVGRESGDGSRESVVSSR